MHWTEAAKKAKTLLRADLAHGEKQLALSAAAEQVGFARQSLRNIIAAYDFLEGLEDVDLRKALAALPYTSIEIYGRWAGYDRDAALAHAERTAVAGVTVKAVIAAEKSARARAYGPKPSFAQSLASAYSPSRYSLEFLPEDMDTHLHRLAVPILSGLPLNGDRATDAYSLALGIKEVLTFFPEGNPRTEHAAPVPDEWRHVIGILEVGERALVEGYRKLAKEVMARAVAGTIRYPVVLVVAPTEEALAAMGSALPPPFHRVGGPDRQKLFKPAAGIGAIRFTTAGTAARDLYGE